MDEEKDLSENSDNGIVGEENKNAISADLIRGHINTIILRTLYERDKYGYEIIEEIEKKSHGQYSLKQPTLYSALKRLEAQGYINAYWKTDEVSLGGRRKYYTLTESGREITEKNQAEWEYSRTVIDNLISDRSFDFSQPAPTPVDFKILKKSTSRVPVVKNDGDESIDDETVSTPSAQHPLDSTQVTENNQTTIVSSDFIVTGDTTTVIERIPDEFATVNVIADETANEKSNSAEVNSEKNDSSMDEEQRRIVHENYMRLISEPVQPVENKVDEVPVADEIDTDKLIYNNKPETERDYRNLINDLFVRTVKYNSNSKPQQKSNIVNEPQTNADYKTQPQEQNSYVEPNVISVRLGDINDKADNDGLKVDTSDYVISTRKKSYNRGATLFKSSLIIGVILLLEFMFSLIFKNKLGVDGVGLAYPFVIFALDVAQILIFGVLFYTDLGKNTRKPSSTVYISACIIITVILILLIFILSILLNVNFSNTGDIFAKIIIPCLVALNIPIFAVCFYAFSKYN